MIITNTTNITTTTTTTTTGAMIGSTEMLLATSCPMAVYNINFQKKVKMAPNPAYLLAVVLVELLGHH